MPGNYCKEKDFLQNQIEIRKEKVITKQLNFKFNGTFKRIHYCEQFRKVVFCKIR